MTPWGFEPDERHFPKRATVQAFPRKPLPFAGFDPVSLTETGPTEPRSIRFAAPVWRLLEARAEAKGLSLHSALRAAIIDWARRTP